MRRNPLICAWLGALLIAPFGTTPPYIAAQERGREGPAPEAIAEAIESVGLITNRWHLVAFEGCPQEDARGRAVFDAVSRIELLPFGFFQLADLWQEQYERCAYAPLDAWFVDAFVRISSADNDGGAILGFLNALPAELPPEMRAALTTRAEDEGVATPYRAAFLGKAAAALSGPERVEASLRAFRRSVPREWVHHESRYLIRDPRTTSAFLANVAAVAHEFSLDVLNTVGSVVATDVRDSRLSAEAPGLAQLRDALLETEGLSPLAQIPRR